MKKFCPYPLWDIRGIEQWLNELAAKGYELKRFSRFWSVGRVEFQPLEEAKHCRYRLDPIGKGEKELRERAANYRELGWRFVEQIGKLYAVYRCDDPEAPELYTDPESLGWAMKKLIRRQWLAAAAVLLWAGLLLRDMFAQLFTAPAVLAMELVLDFERLAPLLLALLVVVGGTVLGVLYQTVRFTGLRRRLAQGELPPVQKRTYPQLRQFLLTLFLVVFLVGYFFFFNWVNSWRERPLPENPAEWDFPHITLSETVPAGTELRENARQTVTLPSQPGQIVFFYDRAYTSWSAPDQYYVTQSGLARLPGEISRQVQLVQDYTKTRAPFLAEWVYAGKVQEWRQRLNALVSEYGAEETISYPGLDQLTRFSYQYWGEDWSGPAMWAVWAVRCSYCISGAPTWKHPWTCWRSGWRRRPSDTPMKMK